MHQPFAPSTAERLPVATRAGVVDGLDVAIDAVAARAAATHGFLRRGWYAAALIAGGGRARTLIVEQEGRPVLALPFVAIGPAALGLATVPGSYWPFRGFPLAPDAGEGALSAAVATLGRHVRALRVGPVGDGDPAVGPLLDAARAAGWTVIDRTVGQTWLLDLPAAPAWPRCSTLRKNRFHEKHLAGHGALDWRYLSGDDWPAAFDLLAQVETESWIASRTDGRDAKFTAAGHGAFWRAAAADPVLARQFHAALLTVDGQPAAFSFDLDVGEHRYAIANSYHPDIAKHSPGRLLHYRNLVAARDRGTTTVDWGSGDSGYKQALGAVAGPVFRDWLLIRPGPSSFAARALAGLWCNPSS